MDDAEEDRGKSITYIRSKLSMWSKIGLGLMTFWVSANCISYATGGLTASYAAFYIPFAYGLNRCMWSQIAMVSLMTISPGPASPCRRAAMLTVPPK